MYRGSRSIIKVGLALAILAQFCLAKNVFDYRMVFYRCRMYNKNDVKGMISTMERAAKAGYNAFVHEPKTRVARTYQKAAEEGTRQVVNKAKELDLALVPCSWGQRDAVEVDTSLAEGFPVKGTPFKVSGGKATVVPSTVAIPSQPTQWKLTPACTADPSVKRSGSSSLRITNPPKHTEISTGAALKPFRAYEFSMWLKTEEYQGALEIEARVSVGGRWLLKRYDRTFMTPQSWSHVGKTMDWKKCKIDFNSLEVTNAKIAIYTGRNSYKGRIWIDDVVIREVGLYETLRGPYKPIVVKSADGGKTYKEGTDFVVDPRCNTFTARSYDYEGHLTIPAGSAIKNGDELLVDWYQFGNVEKILPAADYANPKSWETVQMISEEIQTAYDNPAASLLALDEWRVAFWNPTAKSQYPNASKYMAGVLDRKVKILKNINYGQELMVYSDMYDPYHNARSPFWMVKGGTARTWEGIPKSVIIVNWNAHDRSKGIRFWAGLDAKYPDVFQRQILSINEGGTEKWVAEIKAMEGSGKLRDDAIVGIQYTTWYANYAPLEHVANVCKQAGRWGTGKLKGVGNRKPIQSLPGSDKITLKTNAQGKIAYNFPQNAVSGALHVHDLKGRTVAAKEIEGQKAGGHVAFDTAKLAAGMYWVTLRVLDGSGMAQTTTAKFINM